MAIPPLLITSAVRVAAPFTKLQNQAIRREELLKSVNEWYVLGVREMVVCDGTGYDFSAEITQMRLPKLNFECFAFFNSENVVSERGKGFGEGQIVEYALKRSELIAQSDSFMKCTGKIWCENYLSVLKNFNGQFAADICLPVDRRMVDTRFYIVGTNYYKNNFRAVHEGVNDKEGVYLEHMFFAMAEENMKLNFVTKFPLRVCGMSGSSGKMYKVSSIRLALKYFWRLWEIRVSYKYSNQ